MFKRIAGAVLVLTAAMFAALVLAGCPGPEVEDERQVLRVGKLREVESINPLMIWSMQAYEVINLNYNYLVNWDEDLNPISSLAREWKVDEEGLFWTFYLEEDIVWHDGTPFTAEDVKFTFDYIRDNEMGVFYDFVAAMEEITVVDEHTVTIKTDGPLAWMPNIIVPILPKHIWEEIEPVHAASAFANDNPVGTGPFRVIEFEKGAYVRMEANENYFKGAPALDEVIFIQYANADLMVESLRKGELDVIVDVPGAAFQALEEDADPNIMTLAADSPSFSQIGFNVWTDRAESEGNPLLLDVNIRTAIEYALDRQEIIDVAYAGFGSVGSTLVPPIYEFWHLDPGADFRAYNQAKAVEVLEAAGYAMGDGGIRVSPGGEPLTFNLLVRSESTEQQKAGAVIKDMLAEVGIGITISVIDEGTLTDRILEGDFDLFIWGWFVDMDPTPILRVMTTGEIMAWNETFYSNPVYDELHLRQQRTIDRDERREVIHQMQRIIYNDVPYILISYDPELQAYRTDRFEGWVRTPRTGPVIWTSTVTTYEQLRPIER